MQSALLEAMQEHQVTIGDESFRSKSRSWCWPRRTRSSRRGRTRCPRPRSTASCSRWRSAIPARADERKVVDVALDGLRREVQPVLDPAQLADMKQTAASIYMDDKVKDYVLDIVSATRHPEQYRLEDLKPLIEYGASPRASINLCLAARANAFLVGRGYVTPQDVKDIASTSCGTASS